ncbi:MAG: sigma-54-dependent Fis family transcriptional regulator [Bacteroidales bacterium]|jgi:transcriptional regulator with PAS, ATPase and Fis domain|nr:sigma-54-dependent Fis family transcriptional regulator [Bacteroidales bacterium]MBQ6185886.1 sigma-54-dependent Fis family transcriptional regulator [Bacteroidales bacterium]
MDSQELQRLKNKYDIIGNDAALNRALETAVAVAPTDLTVLITGESGVGKENIPKIIHQNSLRRNGKYFAVNCGAIPEGTIDSELFGHEKGSFTGAIETRRGYFQEADGGTLFLDEIGELPLASQAKLLRVLQSGEFIKVGSSKVEKTDVRVIAATNVNLLYAVSKGKFREDLYYRLNAIQIQMPPLRERKEDIYLFFRKFTSDFSEKFGMGKVSLTNDAIDLLINYRWPGNIRQLKNLAETVTALESEKLTPTSPKCVIDAATLSRYMPKEELNLLPVAAKEERNDSMPDSDRQMIIKAILDLKQEVDDLKAKVGSGHVSAPVLAPAPVREEEPEWQGQGTPVPSGTIGKVVDIKAEEQPSQDLSLNRSKVDIIVKALEKHHGNRKLAAEEVGISERTLYRWIEKYHLD